MVNDVIATLCFVIFISCVNLVPPLMAFFLGTTCETPIDRGKIFLDGKPILGPHKTFRGFIGAIVVGTLVAPILGFSLADGCILAFLSMLGDLASSFVKRRFGFLSGTVVVGWDQFFECAIPGLVWKYQSGISWIFLIFGILLFCVAAYKGSIFFKRILLSPPCNPYPRPLNPRLRFREWKSCEFRRRPFSDLFHFEDAIYYHVTLYILLRALGIYGIGVKNALDLKTTNVSFNFSELPPAFDGYRILFMTDLHLDGNPRIKQAILRHIECIQPVDICILGGDYRFETVGNFSVALEHLRDLVPILKTVSKNGVFAVLGNHDCIDMVYGLEDTGIHFLLNDHALITRSTENICIAGVDDPHYFRCADLSRALLGVPPKKFTILVAHSPEIYRQARYQGVHLYLCGHTHAGQFQFPRIGPVFTHSRTGRQFVYGQWNYGRMQGYTSSGVGASGLFARYGTRGEIVTITLRCGNQGET